MNMFNRRELLITYDLNHLNQLRDTLSQAGIDYQIRSKNLTSPTPFSGGSRARSGSFGIDTSASVEYKLYVGKEDFEFARTLL